MTPPFPPGPDEYIDCNDSQEFDIRGADGKIRKIRVVARPRKQSGDHDKTPEPQDEPELEPRRTPDGGGQPSDAYGAAATRIVAEALGGLDLARTHVDADLLLTPAITRSLRSGDHFPVPVWRINVVGGRITVIRPEDHRDALSGGVVIAVPEPGGQ